MIENALAGIHSEPLNLAHAAMRRRRVGDNLFVTACILIISLIALPPIYAAVPVNVSFLDMLRWPSLGHILLNCAANALVMIGSQFVKGDRLDRKLAGVFSHVVVTHGVLAFFILVARQPHSNLIMPLSAVVSVVGGVLIMFMYHRAVQPRVAVIGPVEAETDIESIGPHDVVVDPTADLRSYDILLTGRMDKLSPDWANALSHAMLCGKPVRHVAEYGEEKRGLVFIDHFDLDHVPVGGLTSYRLRKRLLDIFLIAITAPLTLPIMLLAALAILVTMGRPVLFIQSRAGMGGQPFRMYKLRTMGPPDHEGTARTTSKDDARITPVGRFLRRYRIDELPQLWNVLKGEMSIIGPRPEWTVLSRQYTESLPVYAYRHLVRPGITGWAQVRGGYAGDLAETRVKIGYDLFYIKNLSFSMDIQILVRTAWTLVSGSGAR